MKAMLGVAVFLGACVAGGGMGPDTRSDITARMQSVEGPLSSCYAQGLDPNRPAQGVMVLDFLAAPGSGQFVNVVVTHDEINNPNLRQCVVGTVSRLRLARPTSTRLAISYPIRFSIAPPQ